MKVLATAGNNFKYYFKCPQSLVTFNHAQSSVLICN